MGVSVKDLAGAKLDGFFLKHDKREVTRHTTKKTSNEKVKQLYRLARGGGSRESGGPRLGNDHYEANLSTSSASLNGRNETTKL